MVVVVVVATRVVVLGEMPSISHSRISQSFDSFADLLEICPRCPNFSGLHCHVLRRLQSLSSVNFVSLVVNTENVTAQDSLPTLDMTPLILLYTLYSSLLVGISSEYRKACASCPGFRYPDLAAGQFISPLISLETGRLSYQCCQVPLIP